MALNLFPVRAAIGQATLKDGTSADVFMSPEYARAMSDLLARVGGTDGTSTTELERLIKVLQLGAAQLAQQLTALSAIIDTLKIAQADLEMTEALSNDPVHVHDDIAHIFDSQSALSSTLVQQLADMNMMAAMAGAPTTARNIVTGAKAGNVALASLLSALAKSGVITDLTT